MDKFNIQCQKLIYGIIKNFPLLKGKRIDVKVKTLKLGSMKALKWPFRSVLIVDSYKYENAKDKQIVGVLAHELMHFETYERKGWPRYFLECIIFIIYRKGMTKFENENDLKVIKRGFARELYDNRLYRLGKVSEMERKKIGMSYFTPEKIKSYAQEAEKW